MKVYNHGSHGRGTLFVSPGADHPENSAWIDATTKRPVMFTVKFLGGMAEVDSQLGAYLISKGLAQRTALILPVGVAA